MPSYAWKKNATNLVGEPEVRDIELHKKLLTNPPQERGFGGEWHKK